MFAFKERANVTIIKAEPQIIKEKEIVTQEVVKEISKQEDIQKITDLNSNLAGLSSDIQAKDQEIVAAKSQIEQINVAMAEKDDHID